MTNDLYLSLEKAKKLSQLGIDCGEADRFWTSFCNGFRIEEFSGKTLLREYPYESGMAQNYKTYRLDKLLLRLPEWCIDYRGWSSDHDSLADTISCNERICTMSGELELEAAGYIQGMTINRGQPALDAAADLLVLLKENELLNE